MRSWLKEARQKQGLTEQALADKLHISVSYYDYIEKNKRKQNMDIQLATEISQALDIPIADIISWETA